MKDYKYDFNRNSFKISDDKKHRKYYIKVNEEYIEVSKDIFRVCKSSYDKIRHIYHMEVAKSVLYFEDFDSATFFMSNDKLSMLDQIIIHDLYLIATKELEALNEPNRTIAHLLFIEEMTTRDIGKLLGVSHAAVIYHKQQIQKIIQEKLKKYLPSND